MLFLYLGVRTGFMDVFLVYPIYEGIYFGVVRPSMDIQWAGVFVLFYYSYLPCNSHNEGHLSITNRFLNLLVNRGPSRGHG